MDTIFAAPSCQGAPIMNTAAREPDPKRYGSMTALRICRPRPAAEILGACARVRSNVLIPTPT
jgi:hypothetical protein